MSVTRTHIMLSHLFLGHYVSDSVYSADAAEQWLTFDDSSVFETTCEEVCEMRRADAYILFFQLQVRVQHLQGFFQVFCD